MNDEKNNHLNINSDIDHNDKANQIHQATEMKFPISISAFSLNQLSELYIKLLGSYEAINKENTKLVDKIKKDMFKMEELQNENALIKQILENEKIKNKFIKINNNNTNHNNSNNNKSANIENNDNITYQNVSTIGQSRHRRNFSSSNEALSSEAALKGLQAELDKYKKELILSEAIVSNYKSELENIKVLNENFKTENEILLNSVNELKSHVERSNISFKQLDNENKKLSLENEKLKTEVSKLNENNKSKSNEIIKTFQTLSQKYELNNELTYNRAIEGKKLTEKLIVEMEELKNKIKLCEAEKTDIQGELNFERENIVHMQKDIDEKHEMLLAHKKDNFELTRQLKELTEQTNKLLSSCACAQLNKQLEEKEKNLNELAQEAQNTQSQLLSLTRNNQEISAALNKVKDELSKESKKFTEENLNMYKEIQRLQGLIKQEESEVSKVLEAKSLIEKELEILKAENEKLAKEKELIISNRNAVQNDFNQLTTQYNFLKEKFEKETKFKSHEIKELTDLADTLKRELMKQKELEKKIKNSNLSNEDNLITLQNKLTELQIREKELLAQRKNEEALLAEKINLEKNLAESQKIILFLENQNKENKLKRENLIVENLKNKELLAKLAASGLDLTQPDKGQDKGYKQEQDFSKKENQKHLLFIEEMTQENKKLAEINISLAQEKENLLNNNFNIKLELNSKQEIIEKFFSENKILNDEIINIKSHALGLISQLKIVLNKLHALANRDENTNTCSFFEKSFSENIIRLANQVKLLNTSSVIIANNGENSTSANAHMNSGSDRKNELFNFNSKLDDEIFGIAANMAYLLTESLEKLYQKNLEISENKEILQAELDKNKQNLFDNKINNEKLIAANEQLINEINSLNNHIDLINSDFTRLQNESARLKLKSELNEVHEASSSSNKIKFESKFKLLSKEVQELGSDKLKLQSDLNLENLHKKRIQDLLSM